MPYDSSNPMFNIAVPIPLNKIEKATVKIIFSRPKVTIEKALEGYDYLKSNKKK